MKDYTMRKTFALLLLLAGCGANAPAQLQADLTAVTLSIPCVAVIVNSATGTGSAVSKGLAVATAGMNPACTAADMAVLNAVTTSTVTPVAVPAS